MNKAIILISLFIGLSNFIVAQNFHIVLKTDFKGEVTSGSIDKLISEIQAGKAVRVGWQLDLDKDGKGDLEHWVDANFLSVLNGHVFNQIEPIYRQVPKKDIPQVQIINSEMKWTAIIGTNGKMISRYIIPDINLIEDETVRARLEKRAEISERVVATMWSVN